jgi:5-bromo-4-chloroindolyl phosphate hydrolysis protein
MLKQDKFYYTFLVLLFFAVFYISGWIFKYTEKFEKVKYQECGVTKKDIKFLKLGARATHIQIEQLNQKVDAQTDALVVLSGFLGRIQRPPGI